jgi:hypothetical protein
MQNSDHNIGFWKNANFFAENWQKSQKIVIITSTTSHPGANPTICEFTATTPALK